MAAASTHPQFSFGGWNVVRDPMIPATRGDVPGPGAYHPKEEMMRPTSAALFGVAIDRGQAQKALGGAFLPLEPRSPGPSAYSVPSTIRASKPQPSFAFGKELGAGRTGRRGRAPEPAPGPGAYRPEAAAEKKKTTKTTKKTTWGSSDRDDLSKVRKTEAPDSLADPVSSLKNTLDRPASRACSFGARPTTRSRLPPSPPATEALPRRRRPQSARSSKARAKYDRYAWISAGRDADEVWTTTTTTTPPTSSDYTAVPAGAEMPRAAPYRANPAFSFGRDDRFTEHEYLPHAPTVRSDASPGPVAYESAEALGVQAPAYSFSRVAALNRLFGVDPDEEADRPGPGAYNLRLEDRVAALVDENVHDTHWDSSSSPRTPRTPSSHTTTNNNTTDDDDDDPSTAAVSRASSSERQRARRSPSQAASLQQRSAAASGGKKIPRGSNKVEPPPPQQQGAQKAISSHHQTTTATAAAAAEKSTRQKFVLSPPTAPMGSPLGRPRTPCRTSAVGAAMEFSLRFGEAPTRSSAPAYTFSTTAREDRARLFDEGALNKDNATGRSTPGPATASLNIKTHRVHSGLTYETRPAEYSFVRHDVARDSHVPHQSNDVGPAEFSKDVGMANYPGTPRRRFDRADRRAADLQFVRLDEDLGHTHIILGESHLTFAERSQPAAPTYFNDAAAAKATRAVGPQVTSRRPTAPRHSFSQSTRDAQSQLYSPNRGDHSFRAPVSKHRKFHRH